MRRIVALMLVLGLAAGALAGPAAAKKKKKKKGKKKPPVTFTAEGSLAGGNPSDYMAGGGVTRNEFLATCAIPASQGVDGYVIEVPAAVSKVNSDAALTGSDLIGYDLDMYFFTDTCAPNGEASTAGGDEFGFMPAGTSYVLVSAFVGAEVTFTLKTEEIR